MSKNVRSYYKHHFLEQLDFRYRLYLLGREKELSNKIKIARKLMLLAYKTGLGIYSCPELEQPFLDLAKTISTSANTEYIPNSFLHVMTQAYKGGGHTRVVERWVATSPKDQKHSIILLEQRDVAFSDNLMAVVSTHNGELIVLKENDLINRATKLREIATHYEYVILHIHMHDPTALVAFGTEEFTRPVILFNHADHCYWCGASIVDMVADLRVNDFARNFRGIQNIFPIRIPFEANDVLSKFSRTKEESRRILGLPLDKKIILTVGAEPKYTPFAGCEFCDIIAQSISSMDDVICYGIGPTPETGNWSMHGNKFVAIGSVSYGENYFHYLNACDVYVNSMPIGGGVAMLDAVQFNKPVLSYSLFDTKLGKSLNGIDTTNDLKLFGRQLKEILISKELAQSLAVQQYQAIIECHGIEQWRKNIGVMLGKTPQNHSVHNIKKVPYKINDLAIMVSLWYGTLSSRKITLHDIYHFLKMWMHL